MDFGRFGKMRCVNEWSTVGIIVCIMVALSSTWTTRGKVSLLHLFCCGSFETRCTRIDTISHVKHIPRENGE